MSLDDTIPSIGPEDQIESPVTDFSVINEAFLSSTSASGPEKKQPAEDSTPAEFIYHSPQDYEFHSNGIIVKAYRTFGEEKYPGPEGPIAIPEGTCIGELDFLPNDSEDYTPEKRSQSMIAGLNGLQDFFKLLTEKQKSQDLDPPRYLAGETNPRLARLAQRLGFHLSETKDGYVQVIAKTDTVRERLAALQKHPTISQLQHRAARHIEEAA